MKFIYLIDTIVIDFLSSWDFISIDDIIKKCNLIVDLLKFTSNKKDVGSL